MRLFFFDKGIVKRNIEIIFNNKEALEVKMDEPELQMPTVFTEQLAFS